MHGDAIQSELLLMSSYFVRREKEIKDQRDSVLTKVLYSIYWLCKKEVAHNKLNLILKLLEIIGLADLKDFTKRSNTVLIELVLTLGDQITEDIIQEIKKIQCVWPSYGRGDGTFWYRLARYIHQVLWSKFRRCSDTFCRRKWCSWRFGGNNNYCRNNSWLSHQLIELLGLHNSECKGL